jgi:uncharacterized membrane protein
VIPLLQVLPSVGVAFLASLVEFVEALTIVLAVGTVRGWRSSLAGVVAGVIFLAILVIALGPLLSRAPLNALQIVVGGLLLLFGMRWLRKAILRAAGAIPLHDEEKAFASSVARLNQNADASVGAGIDRLAAGTTFQAVVLEGLEVVFIVIAVGGAGGTLWPAALGAAAAGIVVVALGLIVHRPLAKVPENTLKFVVGVLLSTFGLFWFGEGAGVKWPGDDWSIPGIALLLTVSALATAPIAQRLFAVTAREHA